MINQQYLILPSNTTDYANNKTNKFRVKLPYPMDFDGDWEVALSEIQYPVSWNNIKVKEGNFAIVYNYNGIEIKLKLKITPGFYNGIEELINAINHAIELKDVGFLHLLYLVDVATYRKAKFKLTQPEAFKEWSKLNYTDEQLFRNPHLIPLSLQYSNRDPTISQLHKRMVDSNRRRITAVENLLRDAIKISFNPNIKRVEIKTDPKTINVLEFDKSLQFILGFTSERKLSGQNETIIADYNTDISAGFSTFYIYCDIVKPQCVGNSLEKLIRTVTVSDFTLGSVVNKEFLIPHYVDLITNSFDTIQVEVKDDQGNLVDFQFGKIILKLHFRRKSLLNL